MNEERVTYFAQTDARNKKVTFGIKAKDRTRHVYVIGKTGMGKSTMLENMAVQDIKNGEGMAFIDPHGKTADLLLEYISPERVKDVVYFAPFDTDYPISFNVLESVDPDRRHLVVSSLMSTFKKIWQDAWSARMEYILTNTLLALLEYPEATLLGVNRMLSDKEFRKQVISHVTDPSVKAFWTEEFAHYTERMAAEAVPAIQNKIGQFTANALIRNMIGQPKSSFDIREMMDNKKIIIINLSKGRIGETNTNLLGGMLITKIYLAALSRADVPDRILQTLPNFYLFVDEFQSFANESFADILSEARKYKLNLTMAHQYIEQMEEEVRAAVFGNVGTMIIFRVGAYDAEILEKEFAPQFTAEDIVNLGFAQIYLKLMIDGISSQPFSAVTLPPIAQPEHSSAEEVMEMSRKQFSHTRAEVEKAISSWHEPIFAPKPKKVEHIADNNTSHLATHPEVHAPNKASDKVLVPFSQTIQTQNHASHHTPHSTPELKSNPTETSIPANTHKPFKTAIHEIQNKAPNPDPVSLSSLAHNRNQKPNQKNASPERVNDLRNALASVLDSASKDRIENKTNHPLQPISNQPISNQPILNQNQSTESPKEVSADTLKKVLKID
ncbi:MAG TPA: type IV secretion system DNA-binding domain-containing protein [Candidatus Paceibacterota bacterium]